MINLINYFIHVFKSNPKRKPEISMRPTVTPMNLSDLNPKQISLRVLNDLFIFRSICSNKVNLCACHQIREAKWMKCFTVKAFSVYDNLGHTQCKQ